MSSTTSAAIAAVVAALLFYMTRPRDTPDLQQKTLYVGAASFAVVYALLYFMEDEKALAMKEMLGGEPDF